MAYCLQNTILRDFAPAVQTSSSLLWNVMQRSYLPTTRNKLLVQPSRVKGRLTLEYRAYSLSRNVGKKLPIYAA